VEEIIPLPLEASGEIPSSHTIKIQRSTQNKLEVISSHVGNSSNTLEDLIHQEKGLELKGNIFELILFLKLIRKMSPRCYKSKTKRVTTTKILEKINSHIGIDTHGPIESNCIYTIKLLKEVFSYISKLKKIPSVDYKSFIAKQSWMNPNDKRKLSPGLLLKRYGYTPVLPKVHKLKALCETKIVGQKVTSKNKCENKKIFCTMVKLVLPLIDTGSLSGLSETDLFKRIKKDLSVKSENSITQSSNRFYAKAENIQTACSLTYGLIDAIKRKRPYKHGMNIGKIPNSDSYGNALSRITKLGNKLAYQDMNGNQYSTYGKINPLIRKFLCKLYSYYPPENDNILLEPGIIDVETQALVVQEFQRAPSGNTILGCVSSFMSLMG
jgi:hypothetical protein